MAMHSAKVTGPFATPGVAAGGGSPKREPPGKTGKAAVAAVAVGFSQRIGKAGASAGLQPHIVTMGLKPQELYCSILIRPLKQTAMEKKQSAIDYKAGRTVTKIRHVGKTRDKPAAVYKPTGKMSERFGNTDPPPGRTGQKTRKITRQAWKYDSGGCEDVVPETRNLACRSENDVLTRRNDKSTGRNGIVMRRNEKQYNYLLARSGNPA